MLEELEREKNDEDSNDYKNADTKKSSSRTELG